MALPGLLADREMDHLHVPPEIIYNPRSHLCQYHQCRPRKRAARCRPGSRPCRSPPFGSRPCCCRAHPPHFPTSPGPIVHEVVGQQALDRHAAVEGARLVPPQPPWKSPFRTIATISSYTTRGPRNHKNHLAQGDWSPTVFGPCSSPWCIGRRYLGVGVRTCRASRSFFGCTDSCR